MDIIWLDRSRRELAHIYRYIAADDPGAAPRILRRIHNAVTKLQESPNIGRPGRLPGTRELVVVGTPFIVPYRVRNGVIEILSVIHGARRWPDSL